MGENGLRRHLHAAAAVSLAVLAAACANRQNVAPVMNGLSGTAPEKIEAAPVPPMAPIPRTARPQPPTGPGQRVVVRRGQSVGYLAREYGVTKRAIIEANNLTPPEYKIEIGKTIVIPGGGPGAGEARAPVRAAAAEKPATPPAERPAAARAGKAGEVIPLDEPVPAPKKSAPAIGFPPPAAPMKGRLSPPAAEPVATSASPAGKTVASAEADEPTSPGGHGWRPPSTHSASRTSCSPATRLLPTLRRSARRTASILKTRPTRSWSSARANHRATPPA